MDHSQVLFHDPELSLAANFSAAQHHSVQKNDLPIFKNMLPDVAEAATPPFLLSDLALR